MGDACLALFLNYQTSLAAAGYLSQLEPQIGLEPTTKQVDMDPIGSSQLGLRG